MKARLFFEIELDFNPVIYSVLSKLGTKEYKDKKYIWTFPIENLKRVKEVIGKPIEFDEKLLREQIKLKAFKGKDEIIIKEFPKIFQIIEHRKTDDGIETIKTEINKELVVTIWNNIILKQPLNKSIKTRTVIENIFNLLELKLSHNQPRALRETKTYLTYFYFYDLPILFGNW